MKHIDFEYLEVYQSVGVKGFDYLKRTLEELLNFDVKVIANPTQVLKKSGIKITDVYKRMVFQNDNSVRILISIKKDHKDKVFNIMFDMESDNVHFFESKFYNKLATVISKIIFESFKDNFSNLVSLINSKLIPNIINKCFVPGGYNEEYLSYILMIISNVNNMTFESEIFTSGFILTNSLHEYRKSTFRKGKVFKLSKSINIYTTQVMNNRNWFIVDGVSNYYLISNKGLIKDVYIRNELEYDRCDFLDYYGLNSILSKEDLVFKSISHGQYSVMNKLGLELIKIQNIWRVRNYKILQNLIKSYVDEIKSDVINLIIYYVLYCSHNNISSIIWIPSNLEQYVNLLERNNKILKDTFNIKLIENNEFTKRILKSDGVTVISSNGDIIGYGSVVKLTESNSSGLSGTGELAAKSLSKNGIVIKNSQDGNIKIFYGNGKNVKF